MIYNILCRVSGGVTGTREGLLKDIDGAVKVFDTKTDAEMEARRLMATMNHAFRTADFSYRAVEA